MLAAGQQAPDFELPDQNGEKLNFLILRVGGLCSIFTPRI